MITRMRSAVMALLLATILLLPSTLAAQEFTESQREELGEVGSERRHGSGCERTTAAALRRAENGVRTGARQGRSGPGSPSVPRSTPRGPIRRRSTRS